MNKYNISSDLHENKKHGSLSFPYKIYKGKIPDFLLSYPLHFHEEMEIIFIESGTTTITVNYTSYNVSEGDIILIRPYDIHSITQFEETSCVYYNILFKFTVLENNLTNITYNKHCKPLIDHKLKIPVYNNKSSNLSKLISNQIQYLINNRESHVYDYELMIKSNLFSIMYYISQYETSDTTNVHTLEYYNKLKEVYTYVKNNYQKRISIDDISNKCHYSKSYFMKFFKNQTGCTFNQYLNNYRLEIACRFLVLTKKDITEIANEVGFNNIPYFIRCFNRKYNITPRKFREKNSHTNN